MLAETGEWPVVTVEEIKADQPNALATGPFGSSISAKYFQDSGVPVIRGSNLSEDVGVRLIFDEMAFLAPEKAGEFSRSTAKRGDLVFTCWGTVGQVGLIDEGSPFTEYVISNKQMKLTPNPDRADSLFLYYLFSGPEVSGQIRAQAIGSSVPGFNLSQFRRLSFRLPPLPEQKALACILGSLDDKIALNRRMNQTLEAMARAIFKSWFVDFDPVRSKDGCTFQGSRLGQIPSGWSVAPLGEHVEIVRGLSYKGSGLSDEGLPLHNLNSVYEGGGYKFEGLKFYQGDFRDRHKISSGDLVVANTEQGHDFLLIGYPAIIPRVFRGDGLFSHHLYRLRNLPGSPLGRYFVYLLLLERRFRDRVVGYASGTTVNMLPVAGLQKPLFVLPPTGLMGRFEKVVSPLFERAEQATEESRTLAALREALLPKLLSGEIRVKQAEKIVGEVA